MFLETNNAKVTLDQILRLVSYEQLKEQERGSNLYKEFEDYVFEFELFLADVYSGTVQKDAEYLTLEMILEFCTGTDRVPAFGFHKNIEVYFCDISLPTVSTCGLMLNFPQKNMKEKIVCALSFGGDFGEI